MIEINGLSTLGSGSIVKRSDGEISSLVSSTYFYIVNNCVSFKEKPGLVGSFYKGFCKEKIVTVPPAARKEMSQPSRAVAVRCALSVTFSFSI